MHSQTLFSLSSLALAAEGGANAVPATWDGKCFYPTADSAFELSSYLGRWYQVAGTLAPYTAGCRCISAEYGVNADGTVRVNNSCERRGRLSSVLGTASPADAAYGAGGVFRVRFPGQPAPECPGPNYIVQDYAGEVAIVQTHNFDTLFVLSRKQELDDETIDAWVRRAGLLGSNLTKVEKTDQSGCVFK